MGLATTVMGNWPESAPLFESAGGDSYSVDGYGMVGCLHDALGYDDVSYGRCFLSCASNQCGVMFVSCLLGRHGEGIQGHPRSAVNPPFAVPIYMLVCKRAGPASWLLWSHVSRVRPKLNAREVDQRCVDHDKRKKG